MRVFALISGLMLCVAGAVAPAWAQEEADMLASLRSLMDEASCSGGAGVRAESSNGWWLKGAGWAARTRK